MKCRDRLHELVKEEIEKKDSSTEEWKIAMERSFNRMDNEALFDATSVDNMRILTEHAGVPGHIYPLAILFYDIMPPPPQVEKEIGERREISFHRVRISVAPPVSFQDIAASHEDSEEAFRVPP